MSLLRKSSKELDLPLEYDGLLEMAKAVLLRNGFEASAKHIALFGAFIQSSQQDGLPITEQGFVKALKRAIRHEMAYFLIKPEKRNNESDRTKETAADLAPKA